ncbi:MAG TPA: PTS sugar transporter subunit IIA [Thermoanaerobaculia bacterium]
MQPTPPRPEPNPESFLRLIHRSRRGRLKVYLGYGPGVGKTYQMLVEGQRLRAQGIDVAVGFVETHGRADTASLLLGLEVLPPREVAYRGVRLQEMDLAAVLARRPEVVLIDELAHTNVPGSANAKRYQDVQEVLAAGIHVLTTVNVQHLESLYDTVERLIGVKVKERVPDWVLAEADQIVSVDLATEDLQRRLEEGKVYTPERAAQALKSFFRKGNLEQLRELALREAASVIERRGRLAAGTAGDAGVQAPDQVAVCLASRGADAEALLRYASRLAGRLDRTWYALHVETPDEEPGRLDEATRRALAETLDLARRLGAMVFTFKGEDVVDTILRFAREYRVGNLVIGRPRPGMLRTPAWRRLGRSLGLVRLAPGVPLDELIARAEGLAVIVVDPRAEVAERGLQLPEASEPTEPAPEARPAPPKPAGPAASPRLADLLSPQSVVFFPEPVAKDALFRRLVAAAAAGVAAPGGAPALDAEGVLRGLELRERDGSTFLEEGVALPHVRVVGLAEPRVALGVPRAGVINGQAGRGGRGSQPIEAVFLLLIPETRPETGLQLLATAARLFRDDRFRAGLAAAKTAGEVVELVAGAEAPRPVLPTV